MKRQEWELGGRPIAGMLPRPSAMPPAMRPYWDAYFAVAETDATVETAQRLGAAVLRPL